MALAAQDHKLSMRISPRRRDPGEEPGHLRTVLVHRLSDTVKAVLRRSLKTDEIRGRYCEPCDRWIQGPLYTGIPDRITCEKCGRVFRVEMVIYAEQLPTEDFYGEVHRDGVPEGESPDEGGREQQYAEVGG